MAESVQYVMESMVPEFEDLLAKGLLTKDEMSILIKRRTAFEYAIHRRVPKKVDFLRYIEYEMNFNELRRLRKKRLGYNFLKGASSTSASEFSITRRIYSLFQRALKKFKSDIALWIDFLDWAKINLGFKALARIYSRGLQFHARNPQLWISAAKWEFYENRKVNNSRVLFQRALRFLPENQEIWLEYLRMECEFVSLLKRNQKLSDTLSSSQCEEGQEEEQEDGSFIPLEMLDDEEEAEGDIQETSSSSNLNEIDMKQAEINLLNGAIPKIIYQNAIKSISEESLNKSFFKQIFEEYSNVIPDIPEIEVVESAETGQQNISNEITELNQKLKNDPTDVISWKQRIRITLDQFPLSSINIHSVLALSDWLNKSIEHLSLTHSKDYSMIFLMFIEWICDNCDDTHYELLMHQLDKCAKFPDTVNIAAIKILDWIYRHFEATVLIDFCSTLFKKFALVNSAFSMEAASKLILYLKFNSDKYSNNSLLEDCICRLYEKSASHLQDKRNESDLFEVYLKYYHFLLQCPSKYQQVDFIYKRALSVLHDDSFKKNFIIKAEMLKIQ